MSVRRGAISSDNFDPVKVAREAYTDYDYAAFTVTDGTTNYDCDANQSALFKNVPKATGMILWTDKDVSIRFNNTTLPAISQEAVYAPFEWFDKLLITNLYITNASGADAAIKVFLI